MEGALDSTVLRSRSRAASCGKIFRETPQTQPVLSLSPSVSMEEPALSSPDHLALDSTEDDDIQTGQNTGIALRRAARINIFDDASETDSSRPSSFVETDSDDDLFEERFLDPVKYFQELDDLGLEMYQLSLFPLLIDGTKYSSFDGHISFKGTFLDNAPFQHCTRDQIMEFCIDVTHAANEAANPALGSHYGGHRMYHWEIEHMVHLVECRNIISAVWHRIKKMKEERFCGEFVSLIVLDPSRHAVARLVRIKSNMIENLAIAFENCLFQVISFEPAMVLIDALSTVETDISDACREFLTYLGMSLPVLSTQELWRCVAHILDVTVLSYAGAHTQFIGSESVTSVDLPGPFLESQYFKFSRRRFSCLDSFLEGQEAWVLEPYHNDLTRIDSPPLCLLTDAITFGDIWGPMWKSCVVGHKEIITHYSVGNGAIVPWEPPSRSAIEIRKNETFCHWISDKESRDQKGLTQVMTLNENNIMLIGAPSRLVANNNCRTSRDHQQQMVEALGTITEPGTIEPGRTLETEIFQVQFNPPYIALGYQRQFKRRGQSMKACLLEKWKKEPINRQVRRLEYRLGVEVSACTFNARRVRLIELFGSQTMLNHLRSLSIQWGSTMCRDEFYAALQNADHTTFRTLYNSHPEWQADLGNAIGCCLTALSDTGKIESDLKLFWAPDAEPGVDVTLTSSTLSYIGFLEDTETSATFAVLEGKCLQLTNPKIGKKCLSNHFDPRQLGSDPATEVFSGSILETSVHLNELCVPRSIRDGRIESKRRDGKPPSYPFRWSLWSLNEGDVFQFGRKGYLKTITPLSQGHILAKWGGSSDFRRQLLTLSSKIPVIGEVIVERRIRFHQECIRDREEDTSPVCFLIVSTTRKLLRATYHSQRAPRPRSLSLGPAPARPFSLRLSSTISHPQKVPSPRSPSPRPVSARSNSPEPSSARQPFPVEQPSSSFIEQPYQNNTSTEGIPRAMSMLSQDENNELRSIANTWIMQNRGQQNLRQHWDA